MTTVEELHAKIHLLFSNPLAETFEVSRNYPELNETWINIVQIFDSGIPRGMNLDFLNTMLNELLSLKELGQSCSVITLNFKFSKLLNELNRSLNQQNEFLLNELNRSLNQQNQSWASFDFVVKKVGQPPVNFNYLIEKSDGSCLNNPIKIEKAFGNLDKKVIKINGEAILPDLNLKPCQVLDQTGTVSYFLNIYGKNVYEIIPNNSANAIEIEIFDRDDEFYQPPEWIFPVNETIAQEVYFRIDYRQSGRIHDIFESKVLTLKRNEWKNYLSKLNPNRIIMKTYEIQRFEDPRIPEEMIINSFNLQIQPNDQNELHFDIINSEGEVIGSGELMTFMWLDVILAAPVGGIYDALNAQLTQTGSEQCLILEKHLLNISQIFRTGDSYYALFTSIIQSSGFGKTKICLELLKKYPGIFLVFRKMGETGIPHQIDWMSSLATFVTRASKDDLPFEISEILRSKAMEYTSGRFLIALLKLIETYFATFVELRTERDGITWSRTEAFELIGSHMLLKPSNQNLIQFNIEFTEGDNRTIEQIIEAIKLLINSFSEILGNHQISVNSLYKEIMQPDEESQYPFIIFLDEADNLNERINPGRLPMLNVIRRALHLLDLNTRLLVVAIGTNCDALDFSPAIRDNSLRIMRRKYLLPPFFFSCNWDIFASAFPVHNLELTRELLLNRSIFNLLVSMGRPLWSSCPLIEVINIATAKLKNGAETCLGSLLALLMVRASLTINVHHVLSRNLVKSHMIIVSYISSDAKDMKIGYSSEPVLAMASRRLLNNHQIRESAFRALLDFLEMQAINKGRVVETIHQHLTLFAIDDAPAQSGIPRNIANISNPEFTDDARTLPQEIQRLSACRSHLLELQEEENGGHLITFQDYSNVKRDNYRVISVASFIEGFLELEACHEIFPLIPLNKLNGLVNCSHFVNLERVKSDDFAGLRDVNHDDNFQNVIDKSLLKAGLLRQCGFVLPENYPAADFIIPYLFYNELGQPVYSFLAFQSKSRKETVHQCAYKMAAKLHVVQNPGRINTIDPNPDAIFSDNEMNSIFDNQLVFLTCLENRSNVSTLSSVQKEFKVSLRSRTVPSLAEVEDHRVLEIRNEILNDAYLLYRNHLPNLFNNRISAVSYPAFTQNTAEELKPSLILSKKINPNLQIQKMVWMDPDQDQDQDQDQNHQSSRSLICIASFDIKNMKHLVTENCIDVMKKIANYNPTIFDHVDPLHLGLVQHASLYGKFSNYHLYNPLLRCMRSRTDRKINPIPNYFRNFTLTDLNASVKRCAIGPVDQEIQSQNHRIHQTVTETPQEHIDFEFVDIEGFSSDEGTAMEI